MTIQFQTDLKQLAPELHVGAQLSPADLPVLARRGIRSIISLRPDDEPGVVLSADRLAQLAAAYDITFKHVPIQMADATEPENIDRFAAALQEAVGPAFVYCKSGTRAAIAWALYAARCQPVDRVLTATRRAGFDLAMLQEELHEQAQDYKTETRSDGDYDCGSFALTEPAPSAAA